MTSLLRRTSTSASVLSVNSRPEAVPSSNVSLVHIPGRPKAAGKMLIRSGLRCPRCLLKTWVCLCNRAPRELDRRGTAPRPCERYWLLCLPCMHLFGLHCPRVLHGGHTVRSGSAGLWHHCWQQAVHSSGRRTLCYRLRPGLWKSRSPTLMARHSGRMILAVRRGVPGLTLYVLPGACSHPSNSKQHFNRRSTCRNIHPRFRRNHTSPNRGPKSALAPGSQSTLQCQHWRQGVRVSSLSAGDEGLCKAQPIFQQCQGSQRTAITHN